MAIGKIYPFVGACGLDCVLCPRYYTDGKSKCDGCGSAYSYAAVGCKIFRCCVKEKNFETCAECSDFPCSKFKGIDESDSFVTHRKLMPNLRFIKKQGIKEFLNEQTKRQEFLGQMLEQFNDGRSRSFYCVAATLLPLEALKKSLDLSERKAKEKGAENKDIKNKAKILKENLNETASKELIDLNLRKPSQKKQ
jgi:hypothetical protein